MSEVEEHCFHCGKPRKNANTLIRYQGGLICDSCVISRNQRLITEIESGLYEDQDDDLVEGEDVDANWSPFSGVDNEDQLDAFLKSQDQHTRLKDIQISMEALSLVPRELIYSLRVFPIRRDGDTLIVAISNVGDEMAVDKVRQLTGLKVKVIEVDEEEIQEAIDKFLNI